MNISIYDQYKIKHTYTYTYEDFDYDDFQKCTETEEFEMDGAAFLEKVVAKSVQDRYFSEITFRDDLYTVYIEYFDPMSGHCTSHEYKLQWMPCVQRGE